MITKRNTNILIKRRNIITMIMILMKDVTIIMRITSTNITAINMKKNIIITNTNTIMEVIMIITITQNIKAFKTTSISKPP